MDEDDSIPRAPGGRKLARFLTRLTKPAFKARGFFAGAVLTRWPEVVGAELARMSAPERLHFPKGAAANATLTLRVAPGYAPDIQHLEPLIVERINVFYGFHAVGRLKLVHGPLPVPPPKPVSSSVPLDSAAEERLIAMTAGIADPGLRAQMQRLGRSLSRRKEARESCG
ncbi:MAG: DUF721 domain-containing protein [Alphaproteobacteria bacterium]|jgi:hypothetical protein|nr:DUF721 domain-containing protein [Alphaproteobacteria bacterium]